MTIRRRDLLAGAAATAALARTTWARDLPRDIRINRVVSFELELERPKHVGKNAYRHDHGTKAYDRAVRIYTNAGLEGVGTCWSGANECAALLGQNPRDLFDASKRQAGGPLGRFTSPLWDLAGKILGKPCYELLGGAGSERVPVYDGAIYFTDLRPMHLDDWPDAFRREFDASMSAGHRAFKIKIGRGNLWMIRDQGDARDIEVVRLIRDHVGPEITLAVDGNDGYDLERAKSFLAATADCKFVFAEEMFPMTVDKYRDLRAFIGQHAPGTLIADGENERNPQRMRSWVEADVVDILQGDMNQFGFEDILAEAAMAQTSGARIAPHNWGSLFGYYLQLHVGRAVRNFYMAEQDPLSCKAVIADGFGLSEGMATVPDAPGLGLRMDDAAMADVACVHFDLKA